MNNKKVFNNAKWIIICKVGQSILQFLIGILSVRYLGPENYGLINYAKSVVAFAVPFSQLGLSATLVREFIDAPEKEGEILGTSLLMSFVSSLACITVITSFVATANAREPQTILVCFLYSISLVFQSIELVQYWFHSKLQSKYPSIILLISYITVSLYKVFLLATGKSVYWFAIIFSIEYSIIGFSLLAIYRKQGEQKIAFSLNMAKKLLSRSRYYIFSALMVTLFQNTDHIMLKMIAGNAENGFYSAAVTCATVCNFAYGAIIDSARPVILSNKKIGKMEYEHSISSLYCIISYLALMQGIGFAVFAKLIVQILYGSEYMNVVPVLQILVWYVAFSQMGRIRNIWILAEEKQNLLWRINLTGALMNIAINAWLIPIWGAFGAAFASLFTQFFTNFVLGFGVKNLQKNNRLLVKGLHPGFLIEYLKNVKLH